jgi:kinesin family protein 4/21/27
VFDARVPQAALYDKVSPNLLSSFLEGYNATIMAYGQTGSGKTFTMGSEVHCADGEAGLIPRFMTSIFESLAEKKEALKDFTVQASFLEVYGEDVHDLLDQDRKTLPLRDDANGGVVVAGLTYRAISSADEALDVLNQGTLNRTTAATLMNLTSSRSHAVFTIYLSQTNRADNIDVTTTSKFTLVDLAGSERMKKTGAVGERALEGIKINEGLLALGNVINALADEERISKERKIHVPYRQSKLTRLLQDALGGNSQTLFIACVSSADINVSETLSTLHYANRARNIKNALTKNVDGAALELQRLQSLNALYCKELVRHKFDTDDMESPEVREYFEALHDAAAIHDAPIPILGAPTAALPMDTQGFGESSFGTAFSGVTAAFAATPSRVNTSFIDDILDESILEEVNPAEELAILDQLLELQNQDHEFSKKHRQSQVELKQVQGELDEQEALLLQLRESLKVYHNMKEKYQMLMAEVQQLEVEKLSLADQLEKVSVDPTKGCSLAIKKKLERVEASLVRARSDTRKHQQKYREAEQEAQKCKALERKISQLKKDKISMIKKQKEDTIRHREFTEQKTRELLVLKRKERSAGMKVTKLQTQIQNHKNDLAKRKQYAEKVTNKLKETEAHLMKLLSMRSRELQNRHASPGRRKSIRVPLFKDGFGTNSQELESMMFLLNRLVVDRVTLEQTRVQYEDRVAEYSEIMRKIREEVKVLDIAKQGSDEADEQEQVVEDLELKLEIVSGEIEMLNDKVGTASTANEESEIEMKAKQTIGTLSAPTVRSLLWDIVDKLADSELERQSQSRSMEKKDSVIESFEAEVRSLNQRVSVLSSDLAERRKLAAGDDDPLELIRNLRKELEAANMTLGEARVRSHEKEKLTTELKEDLATTRLELLELSEKLALSETIVRQRLDDNKSERTLDVLQTLWKRIGVSEDERNKARLAIMSCLDDTCQRQVSDARKLKHDIELELKSLREKLSMMSLALGKSMTIDDPMDQSTLIQERDHLQGQVDLVTPEYESMLDRKHRIMKSVQSLKLAMNISFQELSPDLRMLLSDADNDNEAQVPRTGKDIRASMRKGVEDILQALEAGYPVDERDVSAGIIAAPKSLQSEYLDRCEQDLTSLRLQKSRKAVANSDKRKEVHSLVMEMHVTEDDIISLLSTSTVHPIPSWWEKDVAGRVVNLIVKEDDIVDVSTMFTQHLDHICAVLTAVSEQRKKLSSALKDAIDRAQRTLLSTVGEEVDASEAYASFHEALFNLPTLSQEHIQTCIEEINALTAGVEAMTQSEIEALTVVWEALHITTNEKGNFWGDIEDFSKVAGSKETSIFESIHSSDEEWVAEAVKEASTAYRLLSTRLHKLEQIHLEVEKLRSKQDAKSRIISLDSEIRILTSSLAEFEDKKCHKQRLLTKKAGSSTLLREERFRKQMQGKFATKLHQLKVAVKSWKESDGDDFENDILSEEVRMLLDNPDKMDTLVKKRTGFMHLRTVQTKVPLGKRAALHLTPVPESPAIKKQRSSENSSEGSTGSFGSSNSSQPLRTAPAEEAVSSSRPGIENRPPSASRSTNSRKRKPETTQTRSPIKIRSRGRKENAISPLGPQDATASTKRKKTDLSITTRGSMMPFGNILGGDDSPDANSTIR